jgi:hypothetical protein
MFERRTTCHRQVAAWKHEQFNIEMPPFIRVCSLASINRGVLVCNALYATSGEACEVAYCVVDYSLAPGCPPIRVAKWQGISSEIW